MTVRNYNRRIAALFLLISAVVAPDRANAEFFREAPGGWKIAEADSETCGLMNDFEFQGSTTTLFVHKGIDGSTYASVKNRNWSVVEGRSYNIRYKLNGSVYGGASMALSNGFTVDIGKDFERDFVAADALYMTLDDKVIDHLSLDGSAQALKHLNECVSRIKRTFDALQKEKAEFSYIDANPFDEAKPLPLPPGRAPVPISQSWASTNDYPSIALMREHEGVAEFKAMVSDDGRVKDCEIIKSTGHSELDDATCTNVKRRGKFDPATDAD